MNIYFVQMINEKFFRAFLEIGFEDVLFDREMTSYFAYYMPKLEVTEHNMAVGTYRWGSFFVPFLTPPPTY